MFVCIVVSDFIKLLFVCVMKVCKVKVVFDCKVCYEFDGGECSRV